MIEIKTKVAEGGWIQIPEEYQQAIGLHAGDEVILRVEDGVLGIVNKSQAIKYAQDLLRPYLPQGRSLSDELIAERRLEECSEG
jgi:bifunctional DNA-binding transcriptional regulator/antitoxin component of YhaV-PrlF toxin-antitoxin module